MSEISSKVREFANDYSVSGHYGAWGILRADQRQTIRKLCDTCDMFEKTADKLYIENKRLKEEIERLKGGEEAMTDKELNEMIDWCRKKMSNLPLNCTGKIKEGYKVAMLQVMSYLHSKKGGEE